MEEVTTAARARDGAPDDGLALAACATFGNAPTALVEVLHEVQARRGDITEDDIRAIAGALNLSRAEVYGVKSFYRDFQLRRDAGPVVEICLGEACRSRGSGALFEAARARLGSGVEAVYCLGNCALSPAIRIDDAVHGRVADTETIVQLVAEGAP